MSASIGREYVCADGCGYEASTGHSSVLSHDRVRPDACPRCGAGLDPVGGASA